MGTFCGKLDTIFKINYDSLQDYLTMRRQILESYCATNPLIGLSPSAIRLYSALQVFRQTYRSKNDGKWFRAPERDKRLQEIGFSKGDIEQGFTELVNAGLLQTRSQSSTEWYQLK